MNPHPADTPTHPAADISSEAVAAWVANKRHRGNWWDADLLEALAADRDRLSEERDQFLELASIRDARDAEMQVLMRLNNEVVADRDRLRTFVRSARGIIDSFSRDYPKHGWADRAQDPFVSREWLQAESTEIGTARDGGYPRWSGYDEPS